MNRKRELENQLNNLYDKKAQGAQIRSRAKWVSDGEKNTKYFLSLEKKHQTQNVIHEVLSEIVFSPKMTIFLVQCGTTMKTCIVQN